MSIDTDVNKERYAGWVIFEKNRNSVSTTCLFCVSPLSLTKTVQAVVGSIVRTFRRLKKPRNREMSDRGYALHSVRPQLPLIFSTFETYQEILLKEWLVIWHFTVYSVISRDLNIHTVVSVDFKPTNQWPDRPANHRRLHEATVWLPVQWENDCDRRDRNNGVTVFNKWIHRRLRYEAVVRCFHLMRQNVQQMVLKQPIGLPLAAQPSRSGQVWWHTPEQRVTASTLRRYPSSSVWSSSKQTPGPPCWYPSDRTPPDSHHNHYKNQHRSCFQPRCTKWRCL